MALTRENDRESLGYTLLRTEPLPSESITAASPATQPPPPPSPHTAPPTPQIGMEPGALSEISDLLLSYNPRPCFFEAVFLCSPGWSRKLAIFLPPPCKYWVYGKTPSYTASYCFLIRM